MTGLVDFIAQTVTGVHIAVYISEKKEVDEYI